MPTHDAAAGTVTGVPTVSVVVSNFNGAKYLPRLLETLRAQRGVAVEIIIVDRNSTDGSAEILAAHPDVKVVQEPPESGLVTGYAVGAAHATSELLFFCNEDMWSLMGSSTSERNRTVWKTLSRA